MSPADITVDLALYSSLSLVVYTWLLFSCTACLLDCNSLWQCSHIACHISCHSYWAWRYTTLEGPPMSQTPERKVSSPDENSVMV